MSEKKSYINAVESEFVNTVEVVVNIVNKFILPESKKAVYVLSVSFSIGSDCIWFGSSLVYNNVSFLELENGEFGLIDDYIKISGARFDNKLLQRIYDIKNPKGQMEVIMTDIRKALNDISDKTDYDNELIRKRYSTLEPYNEIKGEDINGK